MNAYQSKEPEQREQLNDGLDHASLVPKRRSDLPHARTDGALASCLMKWKGLRLLCHQCWDDHAAEHKDVAFTSAEAVKALACPEQAIVAGCSPNGQMG